MDVREQELLELCKKSIEGKMHPGRVGVRMRQRDFEYLIDLIEEESGTRLSISTLKRLWREDLIHSPHPSTLDALVSVLGYKDWLDFKIQHAPEGEGNQHQNRTSGSSIPFKKPVLAAVSILVVISFVLAVVKFDMLKKVRPPADKEVTFTADKTVAVGVPNTVIFHYDLEGIQADSFFIQQDWNPNHKDAIDPDGAYFSSIYYLPGFHKAKLIANKTILKIQPVHIQTDGWLSAALYNYDDPPVYLTKDEDGDGILSTSEQDILKNRVDIERFRLLTFLNIRNYGELGGGNFKFSTRFRYRDFLNNPCPYIQFTIHTEAHIYFVPFTSRGCVSNLAVKIGEIYKTGRDNDLSAFGTDVREWQDASLVVTDKKGTVYLNGQPIFTTTFRQDFGKIVGLDYRFPGLGEVDYVKLAGPDGKIVYEENFDSIVP